MLLNRKVLGLLSLCLRTILLLPCAISLTQNLDIMMLSDYAIPLMNVSKSFLSIYSRYAAEIFLGFQEFPMLLHYIPHPYVDANSILVNLVSMLRCRLLTELQLLIARTTEMIGTRILLTNL